MTFSDAEKRLLALGDEVLTMKFGLRNMRVLLQALGSPHRQFASIHVAGTNGKGSVCALLDSILRATGRRIGLFTSPHLVSIRERMKVNGKDISPVDFAKSYQRVYSAIRRLRRSRELPAHPTYFETITAIAFDYFARQKVDIVVLEVGMGGRLDSTNVVTPLVSVITNIDFDHERFLGNTIEEIAREKAGIIKTRVPVLTGARRPQALQVIRAVARRRKAPFFHAVAESRISQGSLTLAGSRFTLQTPQHRYQNLEMSLAGRHQIDNAVLAVRALEECSRQMLTLRPEEIVEGLRRAGWPGRFERVNSKPDIFLDGAHNPAGAHALRRVSETLLRDRKIILIYGAMRDKKIRRVFRELVPAAQQVIFTRPSAKRAATPEEIFSIVGEPGCPSYLAEDLPRALKLARRLAKQDFVILVTGSLYLVGEARKFLGNEKNLG